MSSARFPNPLVLNCTAILLALLLAQSANAVLPLPHTFHVGPTGSGSACDSSSIQTDLDAAATGDIIVIDGGLTYSSQHLTISDKSITIKAGPCQLPIGGLPAIVAANAQVTLSGNAGASAPVLSIGGNSSVTLVDLKITGNASNGNGGGIAYSGKGTLTLTNVSVNANTANDGGGINFDGQGGAATLILDTDTQIINNSATGGNLDAGDGGGGVRVTGSGSLTISATGNLVFNNHALNGYGGGIELYGTAAVIDSPGYLGLPLIWQNTAEYGGGLALVSTDPSDAVVSIGARDPNYPLRIEGNSASHTGGGVYLKPDGSLGEGNDDAAFYANSFRIDHNIAAEGSAIYADCDSNAVLTCFYTAHVYLTRGTCAPGVECNTIDGNETEDTNGQPTAGAAILLQNSFFTATGVRIRGNIGAHALRGIGGYELNLADSLLAENQLTAELIVSSDEPLTIDQCTFANDLIGASYVISNNSDLTLTNSIFGEDGTAALNHSGGSLTVQYIVAKDTGGLPSSPNIVQADPLFFDIAHSDYRLRAQTDGVTSKASPAIDFAPATTGTDFIDIDGRQREVDVSLLVNRFGPRDLGAYEMQPFTDRIFANSLGDPYQLVY